MKRTVMPVFAAAALVLLGARAEAHFQVLKPSTDIVSSAEEAAIELDIRFTHPMEQGPVMQMGAPRRFGVMVGGRKHSLLERLDPRKIKGKRAYSASYTVQRPGDHLFYLEPAPYWEPAEGKMIIHYTKVVVDAYGAETGWDRPVGFPVEIEPLARPYGLWSGNVFRGVVTRDGRPVPHAEIEVEYLNEGGRVEPPAGPFVTQVIKADADGVFSYAMPRAGWWGFAALVEADEKMENPDGENVPVELGGLLWVRTVEME